MKLNSKLPIFIIGVTIAVFTFISNGNYETPNLKTINGDINELKDISIKISDSSISNYFDYEYTINKENIKEEKTLKKKYLNSPMKYAELIDVTNNNDLVAHIGYEIDFSGDKNKISLVIDKYKDEKYKKSSNTKNNNEAYINDYDIDSKIINRNKKELDIPIKFKHTHANVLLSKYYKNKTYITSQYYGGDGVNSKSIIQISTLDKEKDDLDIIKNIDLNNELKGYSYVDARFAKKDEDKFYFLITASQSEETYINNLSDLYLMVYDIEENDYKIQKINIPENTYIVNCDIKGENLNIVLGKKTKVLEIIGLEYDIKENKINNQIKVEIENKDVNNRFIFDAVFGEDNIYLLVTNNEYSSNSIPELHTKVYAINRNMGKLVYSGVIDKGLMFNLGVSLEKM